MDALVWIALMLVAIWLAGVVFFKVMGFAIHLALIAAGILFVVWVFRRLTGAGAR